MDIQAKTKQQLENERILVDAVVKDGLEDRHIILNGEIDDSIIERAVMHIANWNNDDAAAEEALTTPPPRIPICIYINSPGGYCTSGLALISAIEQSETPVATVAQGQACSMAFLILVAGHVRLAYRHATLMYHQLSYGMGGYIGEHTDMIAWNTTVQERLDQVVLGRTNITKTQIRKVNEQKTNWFMFPEEAYTLGVIDNIVPQVFRFPKPEKGRVYGA